MVLRSHHRNDQFKKIAIPSVEDNFANSCFPIHNISLFLRNTMIDVEINYKKRKILSYKGALHSASEKFSPMRKFLIE